MRGYHKRFNKFGLRTVKSAGKNNGRIKTSKNVKSAERNPRKAPYKPEKQAMLNTPIFLNFNIYQIVNNDLKMFRKFYHRRKVNEIIKSVVAKSNL